MTTHFHSPLQLARQNGGYVHFHSEPRAILGTGIVRLKGWMAKGEHEIAFKLNGQPIEVVYTHARASLPDLFPGFDAREFEIVVDARSYLKNSSRAIHYTAESDRLLAEGFFVLPLQNTNEAAESRLTFFLHMPKTAGTALRLVMLNAEKQFYKSSRILSIYEESPHFPYSRMGTLSERTLLEVDYIYGHIKFGDHERISKAIGQRPFRYMTVLRNPVDFLMSLYFGHFAVLPSIYDWLKKIETVPLYDNHFCRVIANVPYDEKIGIKHLEHAKENIKSHFSFVGLQERMPHTTRALSMLTGYDLRETNTFKFNISKGSKERDHLDRAEFIDRAMPYMKFDLQLYDYVSELFFSPGVEGSAGPQ